MFHTIVNLSFFNSLQILFYVPTFIFLISTILLVIFLRSKNEIIIIKSYFNVNKLICFILPIVLIFSILEINRNYFGQYFENKKLNIINVDNKPEIKILISEINNLKYLKIFKNLDLKNLEKTEYRSYTVSDKQIESAEYSNNVKYLSKGLTIENYIKYSDNKINYVDTPINIDVKVKDLAQQNSIVKFNSKSNSKNISLKLVNLTIFFILFLTFIFLYFFNTEFINSKQSIKKPILFSLCILLYSFFVFNSSFSLHKQEFELLASVIMAMLFMRAYIIE